MEQAKFGQRVRERREIEGWSQEKLANTVGISRNYLSQIERGIATNLSWQLVQRLASVLGLREETFSRQQDWSSIPPSLREFAEEADLPQGDVEMLAGIQYRGKQPSTAEEWEMLYKAIKIALET
jgi:transcriptional regulator with XRE-family HTH domain